MEILRYLKTIKYYVIFQIFESFLPVSIDFEKIDQLQLILKNKVVYLRAFTNKIRWMWSLLIFGFGRISIEYNHSIKQIFWIWPKQRFFQTFLQIISVRFIQREWFGYVKKEKLWNVLRTICNYLDISKKRLNNDEINISFGISRFRKIYPEIGLIWTNLVIIVVK